MKNENESRNILKALALLSQLGISMAVCVFVGVLSGRTLDRFFGTSPLLLIVFSFIGGAASFKVMYDIVIKDWIDWKNDK